MDSSFRSHPHQRVEKALQQIGIRFLSESEEFSPYCVDIYLPDYHVAIEIDGPYHSARKDAVRDKWLSERYYLPTLRIKAKGRWSSQEKLEKDIKDFIVEWQDSVDERKSNWLVAMNYV